MTTNPTTVDSLLAEFRFDCTDRSRPPSGMTTTRRSYYKGVENSSDPKDVKLYSRLQGILMGRKPVLWHALKTLEDTKFWCREIVEKSEDSIKVGFSSASGMRMIQWGPDSLPVRVADCTLSGMVTHYYAWRSSVQASLEIRCPGREESVFTKQIVSGTAYTTRDTDMVDDGWNLPADPFGLGLITQVEDKLNELQATTHPVGRVESLFLPGQCPSSGTISLWTKL